MVWFEFIWIIQAALAVWMDGGGSFGIRGNIIEVAGCISCVHILTKIILFVLGNCFFCWFTFAFLETTKNIRKEIYYSTVKHSNPLTTPLAGNSQRRGVGLEIPGRGDDIA